MTETRPAAIRDYGKKRPKVPAFARYRGTSVWRKDRRKVRALALYRACEAEKTAPVTG